MIGLEQSDRTVLASIGDEAAGAVEERLAAADSHIADEQWSRHGDITHAGRIGSEDAGAASGAGVFERTAE